MTKKEIKKIVALCQQGVTFRSGIEIILRIELNKKCHFLIPDKIISEIAESIIELDMLLPTTVAHRNNNSIDKSFYNHVIVEEEKPADEPT